MDRRRQPVDRDTTRIRLLYRIPAVPARGRALELLVSGESILRSGNWAGEHVVFDMSGPECGAGLPFPDQSFDVVVLHRTVDRMAALAHRSGKAFVIDDFLSQVKRLLSGGGLAIGCVTNRHGLDGVLRDAKRLLGRASDGLVDDAAAPRPLSVFTCHRALVAAGFIDIRLFSMLPDADDPSRVMSIEMRWSRRRCRQQVKEMRGLVGPMSYAMWQTLAELGVSQYLGPATFFWGRRAC